MSKNPGAGQNEGGGGGGFGGEGGQEFRQEMEDRDEISPENMKYAEQLIPVFGEQVVKQMFSSKWQTREEGLK